MVTATNIFAIVGTIWFAYLLVGLFLLSGRRESQVLFEETRRHKRHPILVVLWVSFMWPKYIRTRER